MRWRGGRCAGVNVRGRARCGAGRLWCGVPEKSGAAVVRCGLPEKSGVNGRIAKMGPCVGCGWRFAERFGLELTM